MNILNIVLRDERGNLDNRVCNTCPCRVCDDCGSCCTMGYWNHPRSYHNGMKTADGTLVYCNPSYMMDGQMVNIRPQICVGKHGW